MCFELVTKASISRVMALANTIWYEHYTPIIGREQVTYMLDTVHSPTAIAQQLTAGSTYHILRCDHQDAGYAAASEQDGCFISKLYVATAFRGRGLASAWLNELQRDYPQQRQWLSVNKRNSNSIAFYQSQGFTISGACVSDIGGGYVMDDYIMQRPAQDGLAPILPTLPNTVQD